MISVSKAQELIREHSPTYDVEKVPTLQAHGRILAEDIKAERENPPFNRIAMDGIGISFNAWKEGKRNFKIQGTQAAGHPPLNLESTDNCLEVMTGAVLPAGCDCVIPVERISIENNYAQLEEALELKLWQNVHLQGSDHQAGFVLAPIGKKLNSPEIAVTAAAGYATVKVSKLPKIAIIATGDELVGAEAQIKPWQIRRSNTTAITSALLSQGYDASEYHLKDDLEVLREKLKQLLHECDMLILTGGVSMGKFDFVPQVFKELGVEEVFHKVTQRPGKPLWFGKKGNKTIFGLPGNPVSAVINFHRYIIPQLAISLGQDISKPVYASLNDDFVFRKNMTRFLPVVVTSSNDGKLLAKHQSTNGSGDFGALSGSDGFLELDAEISEFKQGYTAPFYPW